MPFQRVCQIAGDLFKQSGGLAEASAVALQWHFPQLHCLVGIHQVFMQLE
jgi:hypothetical protein